MSMIYNVFKWLYNRKHTERLVMKYMTLYRDGHVVYHYSLYSRSVVRYDNSNKVHMIQTYIDNVEKTGILFETSDKNKAHEGTGVYTRQSANNKKSTT